MNQPSLKANIQQINWLTCPNGVQSHRFQNAKEYILHIQNCSSLFEKDTQISSESQQYAVCPKSSLHLEKLFDKQTGKTLSLDLVQKKYFKNCRHPYGQALSNKQDIISLGATSLNAYLTLVNNALEEDNQSYQDPQDELIILKDFELSRKQYLNEQQLTQNIESSRNIQFHKSNKVIVNMMLMRSSKDLSVNFSNFRKSCEIFDATDEFHESFQLNVQPDKLSGFLSRLVKDRPGMYLTVTQKNSISIQGQFNRPRDYYFICIGENEIGLLINTQDIQVLTSSKVFKLVFLFQEEYSRKTTEHYQNLMKSCESVEAEKIRNTHRANDKKEIINQPDIKNCNTHVVSFRGDSNTDYIEIESDENDALCPENNEIPVQKSQKSSSVSTLLLHIPQRINNNPEYPTQDQKSNQSQKENDNSIKIIFRKNKNAIQSNKSKVICKENIPLIHHNISKENNNPIKDNISVKIMRSPVISKKDQLIHKYNETLQELRQQEERNGHALMFVNRLSKLISHKKQELRMLQQEK